MAKTATKPLISEVLKNANKLGTKDARVNYLQQQDCTALKDILRINFDETIKLALPPGEPPFKKFDVSGEKLPKQLRFEYPKFANFVQAATPKLNQFKRETIFIDLSNLFTRMMRNYSVMPKIKISNSNILQRL